MNNKDFVQRDVAEIISRELRKAEIKIYKEIMKMFEIEWELQDLKVKINELAKK